MRWREQRMVAELPAGEAALRYVVTLEDGPVLELAAY